MLFFRSEERVTSWCRAMHLTQGPLVGLDPLWRLAVAWYATRLRPDSRRPQPAEMRAIFAGAGLTGEFWDPEADRFG